MTDLAEFLLARIAEDSEVHPQWGFPMNVVLHDTGCMVLGAVERSDATCDCGMPARYRAECEAKRRIVEWHKAWPVLVEMPPAFDQLGDDLSSTTFRMSREIAWATEQEYRKRFGSEPPTGPVLRLLALPYADHPDYQPEWKP